MNVRFYGVLIIKQSLEVVMRVEPFTSLKDIKSIKKLLADNLRDRLLFIMGINSGLRVQDLLALRVSAVSSLKTGDRVALREKKTGKENVLIINKEIYDALTEFLRVSKPLEEHFLFKSRKGKNYPLTTFAVTKYVKKWADSINIKGNFGAHTLRKTWAFIMRTQYNVPWEVITTRFQHASPAITMRYLGVQRKEVEDSLLNTI